MVATLKERGFIGDNYARVAQDFFASVAKPPETRPPQHPSQRRPSRVRPRTRLSDPIWVGDWYGDNPWSAVRAAAEKARDKRFVFVAYNVPSATSVSTAPAALPRVRTTGGGLGSSPMPPR